MSNLSSYKQTFIDNLHGRDEEIYDLIGKTEKDLFYSSLINVEKEFEKKIYSIFTTIEYIFEDKTIIPKEYIQKIINVLLKDNELRKDIINTIINKISEKEKIYDSIFRNHNFEDKAFISMIVKELKEKFYEYLLKFIVNSEKCGYIFFKSKIINYTDLSKEIWNKFIKNYDFFKDLGIQGNKIILKSYNLPSNDSIKTIRKIIDIKKNKYKEEENKIRNSIFLSDLLYDEKMDENSEEFNSKEKLINEYLKNNQQNLSDVKYSSIKDLIKLYFVLPKEDLVNYLVKLLKEDELYKLIAETQLKEGLDLLFEDYYRQYCIEIDRKETRESVELIKFLTSLRFSFDDENIEANYIKKVLWLEIYKNEMTYILNIMKELLTIKPDIVSLIKNKFENKEVEYIISSHHPLFKKEINYPFLIYLDSIGIIMLEIMLKNNLQSLINNLSIISNINKNAEIFYLNLKLLSKDFYRFKITYLITELFNKKEIINQLNHFINSLFIERQLIKENKINNTFE